MNRETLIATLKGKAARLREEGATSLYLYGSRARNQQRPDSDIDLYVEYDPTSRFSLMNLAGIYVALEDLALPVSVTTRDSLHPKLRDRIEAEAIQIF